MEYAILNNGKKIPFIGLGVYRMEHNEESVDIINYALSEAKYRHLDTASYYKNEDIVGKAIQKSGIPREELFITTKVWNDDQRNGTVREAFEKSLKELKLDYVDLYLVHWPVADKFVETWHILEDLYKSGRVKSIGVSNFKEHHLETLKESATILPVINQVESNPYLTQEPLLNYCKKNNIQMAAWAPLGAGKVNLLKEPILVDLAKKHDKSAAQIILRWNFQRGVVAIPKSSNKDRLKQNIDIFNFELSADDINQINSLNKNQRKGADPDTFDF